MKHCILLVLFPLLLFGQGKDNFKIPDVIPPSPTVASLMQFEEVPIDFYTGQPDINVPLHSKKLNADLTLPIALKYTTQGIKRTERSGWAGTGWSLEAGGTISRTVRGLPDDAKPSSTGDKIGIGVYNLPNNEFFNFTGTLSDLDKNRYLWYVGGTQYRKDDSELDLYQFSVAGKTGRFVVIKTGPQNLEAKMLTKDERIRIKVFHSDLVITKFEMTDGNGNKFIFGNGQTEVTTTIPWSVTQFMDTPQTAPDPNTPKAASTFISAWHLTEITAGNGQNLATFAYSAPVTESFDSYISSTTNTPQFPTMLTPYLTGGLLDNPYIAYNKSALMPKSVQSGSAISISTKKLSRITFRDGTSVRLSSILGHPESGGSILSSIELWDSKNVKIKQYSLVMQSSTRLWLLKVREQPTNMPELVHTFDYFERTALPGFGRGDNWGYHSVDNRATGGTYDLLAFKRGLLTKITYPTGGVKEFDFEPHTFSYQGNSLLSEAVCNANPDNFFESTKTATFNVVGSNSTSIPPSVSEIVANTYNVQAQVYFNVTSQSPRNIDLGITEPGSYYYELCIQKVGASSPEHSIPLDGTSPVIISLSSPGQYTYFVRYKLLSTPSNGGVSVSVGVVIHYGNKRLGNNYRQYLMGGGARIKEIRFKDNPTAQTNERKFRYYYDEPKPGETIPTAIGEYVIDITAPTIKSSGSVDAIIGSLNRKYSYNHQAFLKNTSTGACTGTPIPIAYTVETDEPIAQLTKGGYVGYKYVRVREVGVGYTAYTYTTAQDWPTPAQVFTYPFMPAPNLDYKRGLLLKKQVYNQEGKVVEETINTYDYNYMVDSVAQSYVHTTMPCAWAQFYRDYDAYASGSASEYSCGVQPGNCGPTAPFSFITDNLTACWATLENTTKKEYYYENGIPSVTETIAEYDYNDSNYQVKTERKILKEGSETNTYETRYEFPVGGFNTLLFDGAEVTTIGQMANDYNVINKPVVIATYRNNDPLQKVINKYGVFEGIPQIKEIESAKDTSLQGEDRVLFTKYDAIGNPLEVAMKDGTKICFIWGYNDTLPIAKIESSDGYDAVVSQITSNTLASVKAASNAASYNESSLKSMLDSIRSTLSGAMVTTLIHDPAIGVKEIKDPRGNFFIYEYDNLGRLKGIKDRDNNYVSENFYNYRPQP